MIKVLDSCTKGLNCSSKNLKYKHSAVSHMGSSKVQFKLWQLISV